jgi:hypothetical protein
MTLPENDIRRATMSFAVNPKVALLQDIADADP